MEPIEIAINDIIYIALPMPDGSFEIFENTNRLGRIEPVIQDSGNILWSTADLMSFELAQEIGGRIENYEL